MALFHCPIVYGYQSLNDYRKFLIQQKTGVVNKNKGYSNPALLPYKDLITE